MYIHTYIYTYIFDEAVCVWQPRGLVRKPLLFKRLISFEFWIENLCLPNRWNFFRTDSSSCSNGSIIFWTDNPSHSNRFLSVYVFVWEIIINKRLKIFKTYSWGFDCLFKNEQHDCLNMMWQVNMTGKRSSWPVKLPFWPDIVCWPTVILSPDTCTCNNLTETPN